MKALPLEGSLPAKILILDDSAFDRAQIRRVLIQARLGSNFHEAESLAALDKALERETFDVAMLDYDLPDGTGHDALRRLQACDRNAQPVSVMITGNEAPHIAQGALTLGCSSCFLKSELNAHALTKAITAGL